MNKILAVKNIDIYIVIAILVVFALTSIFWSDTSNVQSAHQITLLLRPCKLVDGIHTESPHFEVGSTPYICGEVLSEYLPLELNYYLVNSTNNELVSSEYIKITSHEFIVDLPSDLDIGQYEFEIKAGRRKQLASTNFEIVGQNQ